MIYEYKIDNNEYYPEDHDAISIFTNEKISFVEFQSIVKDAFQLCGNKDVYYNEVANKIVEIDERFFFPETTATAFVGMEEDDYENEIRGFRQRKF